MPLNENVYHQHGICYKAEPQTINCEGCAFKAADNCQRLPSCVAHKRRDRRDIIWVRKSHYG